MVASTFVNSSCDIKINVNIVKNCCRNLAVRGLKRAFKVLIITQQWIVQIASYLKDSFYRWFAMI